MAHWRLITALLAGLLAPGAVVAQAASKALDSFEQICLPGSGQAETAAAFENAGWSRATPEFEKYLAQDIVEPDEAKLFVFNSDGGLIFAAALHETRKRLIWTTDLDVCMVRVFVETPEPMRTDFLSRMDSEPTRSVDTAEVRANLWLEFLYFDQVAFRAVNIQEGVWSVTTYRTLING